MGQSKERIGQLVYLSDVNEQNEPYRMFADEPDCMTVAKAAELMAVSIQTVRREIAAGRLRAAHVGKRVVLTKKAIIDYLREMECAW